MRRPSGSAWCPCAWTTTRSHAEALRVARRWPTGGTARSVDQAGPQQLVPDGRPDLRGLAGLEFFGFGGPDIVEGTASLLEKRGPDFGASREKHPLDL